MNSPIFTIQMNNTLTLPHDWFIEASLWWRSHGDWKNWAYTHTLSTVNLRVYKMFLNKSLTVYLGVMIYSTVRYTRQIYTAEM